MISYKTVYGETVNVSIDEAISHFEYGISHDIFSEPVTSYAKLAIMALEEYKKTNITPKEKCDTCMLRYVCEEQAEYECKKRNYSDYNPDSSVRK